MASAEGLQVDSLSPLYSYIIAVWLCPAVPGDYNARWDSILQISQ